MSTLVFPGKLRTEKGCAWAESLISVHHTVFIYCFVYGLPRHYMLINSSPHLKAMTISTQKALACLGNYTKMAILQFPRSHFFLFSVNNMKQLPTFLPLPHLTVVHNIGS